MTDKKFKNGKDSLHSRFSSEKKFGEPEEFRRRKKENAGDNDSDVESGVIFGRNPVLEVLCSGRVPDKLFVAKGEKEGSITLIVSKAISLGIPIVSVDKRKLDSLCNGGNHQGVAASISFKEYCTIDDILRFAEEKNEKPFVVIADNIEDPGNLGAMIRCCEISGVHGLIIPKRHGVGITSVVAKSSAGALEHMRIAKVTNIAAAIDELKKKGLWIYAAEAGGQNIKTCDMTGSSAFVFGSEGRGISKLVLDKCDFRVSIDMYGKVNSLNVSCACAVVLCEAAYQRHINNK